MITGAWSAIFYGRPRASQDIDFVVELGSGNVQKVLDAVNRKSMFNVLHLPTMLKLDFWILTDEEFDKSRFKRRKKVKILNSFIEMATAEDTIVQKLRWYKMGGIEKHLIDAAFVYQIQKTNLDKKYLGFWVKKLKLERYYRKLEKIDLEEHF